MNGTVKQFKDTLEVMKSIYPFEDENTRIQTKNAECLEHNYLSLVTRDEKTGILIEMTRRVDANNA